MIYCLNPDCNHLNPETQAECEKCSSLLLIANRYRAVNVIGQGGFGKTFLGIDDRHRNLPRCVIKQLLPSRRNKNQKNWQQFQEEANRLQKLNSHPQIPQLLGFFAQENRYYLIQEFIDGSNLATELAEEGVFNELKIRHLLNDLLPIMDFIHGQNIIHRDIKPENIIRRTNDGKLFLVDFGASKLVSQPDILKTGTVIGSAEYIAPEQTRGKAVFASDIYSLGVTCVHLLTNVSPFDLIDLNNVWIWQQYLVNNPVSSNLSHLLDQMISFSLRQRYQSAQEIIKDLNNLSLPTPPNFKKSIKSISLLTIISLTIVNLLNLLPTKTNQGRSISKLEKEALEGLILLTNIQNDYYQKNGEFLLKSPYLPFAQGHLFTIKPINEQVISIIALAKQENLRNFLVMIWGGQNSPENQAKILNYQPKEDDWGTLSLPNLSSQEVKYLTRITYCETEKPLKKFPSFQSLNITKSVPLSHEELSCPSDYIYSLSMISIIAEYAAKPLPAIIYDLDGENLTINEEKE
jgi:serine/threonine protein kinase